MSFGSLCFPKVAVQAVTLVLFLCCFNTPASAITSQKSVVKIYSTIQREDYQTPWQSGRPVNATGSGFIIDKKRILTNAHVVSDSKFIEIQKDGDPGRYRATVAFVGHDCDLALLAVEDESFFNDTKPLKLASSIPSLNDEVTALGFPIGGNRISITKGVVSRIDYSVYSHSGADQHLVIQVDAAINPGNSGGPIIFKNKVIAVAFQGLAWGENIGYGIPLPVIMHFLRDIEDGHYDGYPELGVGHLDIRNEALRKDLKMTEDMTGVLVYHVDPFASAHEIIKPGDVMLSMDGYSIANDGTIQLGRDTVIYAELLERKQAGESVKCDLWRKGTNLSVNITLKVMDDPFVFRNSYDKRPGYFITGGLVFCPLTSEYLAPFRREINDSRVQKLVYYSQFVKLDKLYENRKEFVVLTRRLPDEVNTYADPFINCIVETVNNVHIGEMKDLKEAFSRPIDGFHVIKFDGMDDFLVLNENAVKMANIEIFSQYGIHSPEYIGDNN